MADPIDRSQIEEELEMAREARARGNEGMARVCARRAAGWTIGLVWADEIPAGIGGNAYEVLRWYADRDEGEQDLRRAAHRLTVRITEEHTLPHPQDPLDDATTIVRSLLPGSPTAGEGEAGP